MGVPVEKADADVEALAKDTEVVAAKTLLIDHDDSFTHILAHTLGQASGSMPTVIAHRDFSADDLEGITHIVLSPGPGHPDEYQTVDTLLKHWNGTSPILGVCLGHQALAQHFGATIQHAPKVVHGKTSQLKHDGTGLFKELPPELSVMRYHSLAVSKLPTDLKATAHSEDRVLMAYHHKDLPIQGVQFHPESIGSEAGLELLKNFFNLGTVHHLVK